tara:strand:+ start:11812 stop:12678 length:867 start_codon:yes stop_codon:yes gene_type:complete
MISRAVAASSLSAAFRLTKASGTAALGAGFPRWLKFSRRRKSIMPMKIRIAATTAICALSANMALAQSESASKQTTGKEQSPDSVTCADITAMDTALVPGTLYYIAGYKKGSDAGMSAGQGGGQSAAAGASGATGSASGDSSATTAADGSTVTSDANTSANSAMDKPASDAATAADGSAITRDANTSANSGSSGAASDTTMATDSSATAAGADASASASGGGQSGGGMSADAGGSQAGSAGGDVAIMRVSGMFEIPVEEVITACTDTPEMKAADAIEQKRGAAGSMSN